MGVVGGAYAAGMSPGEIEALVDLGERIEVEIDIEAVRQPAARVA